MIVVLFTSSCGLAVSTTKTDMMDVSLKVILQLLLSRLYKLLSVFFVGEDTLYLLSRPGNIYQAQIDQSPHIQS